MPPCRTHIRNSVDLWRVANPYRKGATVMKRVVVLATLMLLACTGPKAPPEPTATPEPLTVEEYAKAVCDSEERPEPRTWGEAKDRTQGVIDRIDTVTDLPDEVRNYHLSTLAWMKAFLKASEGKSPNDMFNHFELAGDSDYTTTAFYAESARSDLDDETRAILKSHGCLDGEE